MATTLYLKGDGTDPSYSVAGYKVHPLAFNPLASGSHHCSATAVASGDHIEIKDTIDGGGSPVIFVLQVNAVTIAGTISFTIDGNESAMTTNATFGVRIVRLDGSGTVLSEVVANANAGHKDNAELGTADTVATWSATPTSTSFNDGDWLGVIVHADAFGTMGSGSITMLLSSGFADRLVFTETITEFSGPSDQSVSPAALALSLTPVAPQLQIDQVVSPGALGLTLAPVAPRTDQAIAPAALARTLTLATPTRFDQTVNPAAAARTLIPVAPRIDQELRVAAVALAVAALAPRIDPSVAPATLALALGILAPTRIDQNVSPGALALALTEPAPTISQGALDQSVTPDAIALATAALAPRVDQSISPAAIALTLSTLAPQIDQSTSPAALALTLAALAPARIDQELRPAALALTLAALAPRVDQSVAPAQLALVLNALAPTVRIDQSVSPAQLALSLGIPAPRIDQAVTPAALALASAALAPTRLDQTVPLGVLALTLALLAPDVQVAGAGDQSVSPAAIALATSAVAPTRIDQDLSFDEALALTITLLDTQAISFPQSVSPAAIALTLAKLAPRVDHVLSPAAIALTLTQFSPAAMHFTLNLINILLEIDQPVPTIQGGTVAGLAPGADPWFRRIEAPVGPPIEAWSLYVNLIGRYGLAEGRQIYERMLEERKGPFRAGGKYDPDRAIRAEDPTRGVPHIDIPKARRN